MAVKRDQIGSEAGNSPNFPTLCVLNPKLLQNWPIYSVKLLSMTLSKYERPNTAGCIGSDILLLPREIDLDPKPRGRRHDTLPMSIIGNGRLEQRYSIERHCGNLWIGPLRNRCRGELVFFGNGFKQEEDRSLASRKVL